MPTLGILYHVGEGVRGQDESTNSCLVHYNVRFIHRHLPTLLAFSEEEISYELFLVHVLESPLFPLSSSKCGAALVSAQALMREERYPHSMRPSRFVANVQTPHS